MWGWTDQSSSGSTLFKLSCSLSHPITWKCQSTSDIAREVIQMLRRRFSCLMDNDGLIFSLHSPQSSWALRHVRPGIWCQCCTLSKGKTWFPPSSVLLFGSGRSLLSELPFLHSVTFLSTKRGLNSELWAAVLAVNKTSTKGINWEIPKVYTGVHLHLGVLVCTRNRDCLPEILFIPSCNYLQCRKCYCQALEGEPGCSSAQLGYHKIIKQILATLSKSVVAKFAVDYICLDSF